MWDSRNQHLHNKEQLQNLEGAEILNKVIEKEWEFGLGRLPILEFSFFFRIKKQKLMKKSLESKKDWLASVKMARVLYEDYTVEDEFDTNKALQNWIGMEIREEK